MNNQKILIIIFIFFLPIRAGYTSYNFQKDDVQAQTSPDISDEVKSYCKDFAEKNHFSRFIITPLSGGSSHAEVFKITLIKKEKYLKCVLKILPKNIDIEALNNEILVHKIAEKEGIAPKLYKISKQFIIMAYIQGDTLKSENLKNKRTLIKIGKTLARLHKNKYVKNFNIKKNWSLKDKIIWRYKNCIKGKHNLVPTCYEELYKKYLLKLSRNKNDDVLCHGDLNHGNIMIGPKEKISFIDWTSNAIDNRYNDLSFFSSSNHLNNNEEKIFLKSYFQRPPTNEELKKFKDAKIKSYFLTASIYLAKTNNQWENLDACLFRKSLKSAESYNYKVNLYDQDKKKIRDYGLGFLKSYMKAQGVWNKYYQKWVKTQSDRRISWGKLPQNSS